MESMVDDPYRGVVSWSVPENVMATVTLFHTGKVRGQELLDVCCQKCG